MDNQTPNRQNDRPNSDTTGTTGTRTDSRDVSSTSGSGRGAEQIRSEGQNENDRPNSDKNNPDASTQSGEKNTTGTTDSIKR